MAKIKDTVSTITGKNNRANKTPDQDAASGLAYLERRMNIEREKFEYEMTKLV